jgi:hypothetical protein
MSLLRGCKRMLTRFSLWVCQVFPQRLRLAMTEPGYFRVRPTIGMLITAVPDDIIFRLCMPDQV